MSNATQFTLAPKGKHTGDRQSALSLDFGTSFGIVQDCSQLVSMDATGAKVTQPNYLACEDGHFLARLTLCASSGACNPCAAKAGDSSSIFAVGRMAGSITKHSFT